VTSLPGFGRRCPRASAFVAPASSLDSLQGTFEKINLLDLLGEEALELADFLA
jgi:hypothetical protein